MRKGRQNTQAQVFAIIKQEKVMRKEMIHKSEVLGKSEMPN